MTVFDTALNTLFADDNVAVDSSYTPAAGAPYSVRVIVDKNVDLIGIGDSDIADRRTVLTVQNTEVSAPGPGDTFLIGAVTYTVDRFIETDGSITALSVK